MFRNLKGKLDNQIEITECMEEVKKVQNIRSYALRELAFFYHYLYFLISKIKLVVILKLKPPFIATDNKENLLEQLVFNN